MRIIYDQSGLKPPGAIQPIQPAGTVRRPVLVMRLGQSEADNPGNMKADAGARPGWESGQVIAGHETEAVWKTSDEALERDRGVRHHENAHLSALGPYAASGILYDTATGVDGETLAVGGRIAVDLTEVPGDPEASLRKARVVLNAAHAPGDPSAADQRVAARAYRLMQAAQAELKVDLSA